MTEYVAVHVADLARFNRQITGFLMESSDPDSEFFVDVHLPDQRRLSRAISKGERTLEYGPMTPDIVAMFIRLSGDGWAKASTSQELEEVLGADFHSIDNDEVCDIGLHAVIEQAIVEGLVVQVFVRRGGEGGSLCLVCEVEQV